jgi:hypothetical protein
MPGFLEIEGVQQPPDPTTDAVGMPAVKQTRGAVHPPGALVVPQMMVAVGRGG